MNMQMLIPLVASLVGFIAVLLLVLGVTGAVNTRNKLSNLDSRMSARGGDRTRNAQREAGLAERLASAASRSAERLGERVKPASAEELNALAIRLVRGGYPSHNASAAFWGAKLCLTILGGGAGLCAKLVTPDMPLGLTLIAITIPAAIGLYLPDVWLSWRIATRRREVLYSLPDALDLLVVCVESGMGLDQALNRVGNELSMASPTLSGEFKTLILELRAGMKRADALRNLALRVDLEDMNSLVTLINQADAFGTSIAGTLRVYSDALRTTRRHRAEEAAAKMPVKLLFPLIFCIMPALFVAIMGPAAIQLMRAFSRF
ncbi:tight adherence protein C [Desulfobaculum xiamenense]|uniref:Tight adherence protein C n=1 Tax=Desulfobaculum xiamenense TaxID=995050 RepID=A0A846QGA3_9BACT|nr:type II secretion system F family protein [Desulfobaculum xiamenense]NJB67261.1 tight adherence protein C [Desulfobaculum xiamenense]